MMLIAVIQVNKLSLNVHRFEQDIARLLPNCESLTEAHLVDFVTRYEHLCVVYCQRWGAMGKHWPSCGAPERKDGLEAAT